MTIRRHQLILPKRSCAERMVYVPEGGPILARFSCAATSVLQLPDWLDRKEDCAPLR